MNEETLIKNILHGDTRCFATLVDKYKDMVFAVVMRMVKNREDAEDLTQEIFVKAYTSLPKFKGESKFSTWLFRIAFNEASTMYRSNSLDTTPVEDWMNFEESADTGFITQMGELRSQERSQYIQKAMDRMDSRDAMILTLFYLNEHNIAEISDICSMSTANVKTTLSRARVRMAQILKTMLGKDAARILINDEMKLGNAMETFDEMMRSAFQGMGTSHSFTPRLMVRIEKEKEMARQRRLSRISNRIAATIVVTSLITIILMATCFSSAGISWDILEDFRIKLAAFASDTYSNFSASVSISSIIRTVTICMGIFAVIFWDTLLGKFYMKK